jgi:hypothetical protein
MSGSDAEFRLANGTSKIIRIVGARSLVPGFDYLVICNNSISNNLPSERGRGERDGHSRLSSTVLYTRVAPLEVKASHQRYHPGNRRHAAD